MEINYKGIDYGSGKTNIDLETGIRYGVINQNEVGESWFDSSEMQYGETYCPECGNVIYEDTPEDYDDTIEDFYCEHCNKSFWSDQCEFEEIGYTYNEDGYVCEQSADDTDIFITKSLYFTYCQFCSPCAPGAGYLMNVRDQETGIKAYCFGHDWFEDGKAPYPVYSVESGELIETEKA